MQDLLDKVLGIQHIDGNLPEAVEIEHTRRKDGSIDYVHLINYTGHVLKAYYAPVPIYDLEVEIPWEKGEPKKVYSMVNETPIQFVYEEGKLKLFVAKLELFEGIKIC